MNYPISLPKHFCVVLTCFLESFEETHFEKHIEEENIVLYKNMKGLSIYSYLLHKPG